MRPALVAQQQRIALAEVAGSRWRSCITLHQAAIGVLPVAGGDALRHDRALGVLAEVDHLGAGVGLLTMIGHGHGVEFAHRIVALQDAARDTSR